MSEIKEYLNWDWSSASTSSVNTDQIPEQTLYFSRIASSSDAEATPPVFEQVAIGNTVTEALSSYLSHVIANSADNSLDQKQLEEQLEAIVSVSGASETVDIGPLFQEARHKQGFASESGHHLWMLSPVGTSSDEQTSETTQGNSHKAALPETLLAPLNNLNRAQNEYNKTADRLELLQFQLYADWYKYMQCSYPSLGDTSNYPDAEEVKEYIETQSLIQIDMVKAQLGKLEITEYEDNNATNEFTVKDISSTENTSRHNTASKVVSVFETLKTALDEYNNNHPKAKYEIDQTPEPSFYKPNNPVVVFIANKQSSNSDQAADSSNRDDDQESTSNELQGLVEYLGEIRGNNSAIKDILGDINKDASLFQSNNYRWQPTLMDWLVSFYPVNDYSNMDSDGCYNVSYIQNNYELDEDDIDLTRQQSQLDTAQQYRGRSYVTASVLDQYSERLNYYINQHTGAADQAEEAEEAEEAETTAADAKDSTSGPLHTANQALKQLDQIYVLGQSLEGFNRLLLQHTDSPVLPIDEPLGFEHFQQFTQQVSEALEGAYVGTPEPNVTFMPLRSGELDLQELVVYDSFGRDSRASTQTVVSPHTMSLAVGNPNKQERCWLNPRISQAARLNFRLLTAEPMLNGKEMQLTARPASSPVIGWLVLNYLDNSIVCYDQQGKMLGSLRQDESSDDSQDESGYEYEPWRAAPGSLEEFHPQETFGDINKHLHRTLKYLHQTALNTTGPGNGFIRNLMSALQGAEENIHPESTAGSQSLSLLISSPIAIVRGRINLEVKGGLYSDQNWTAFRTRIQSPQSFTDDYEKVKFPIRLGEYKRFNDGLLGYWTERPGYKIAEDEEGTNTPSDNPFATGFRVNDSRQASFNSDDIQARIKQQYPNAIIPKTEGDLEIPVELIQYLSQKASQIKRQDLAGQFPPWGGQIFDQLVNDQIFNVDTDSTSNIKYYADANALEQAIDDEPTNVTMLVDPNGLIHATCGVLPVTHTRIPPEYVTEALADIEVSFYSGPLISPAEQIHISLPEESGYEWQWLYPESQTVNNQAATNSTTSDSSTNSTAENNSTWSKLPNYLLIGNAGVASAWEELQGQYPELKKQTDLNHELLIDYLVEKSLLFKLDPTNTLLPANNNEDTDWYRLALKLPEETETTETTDVWEIYLSSL
ncbi:MAG: hypothetical protein ACPGYX_04460, partial [Oceanobacter sp.]